MSNTQSLVYYKKENGEDEMLFLIGLLVLTIVGVAIARSFSFCDHEAIHMTSSIIAGLFGAVLLVALITLPVNYYQTKAEVDRYYALKNTIEVSRTDGASEIERAALIQEIAGYNKDLASVKFWNDTIFGIYYYDGLAELEFLE